MKARKVKKLDPAGPLAENAARIVLTRLDELRSFIPAALDPASVAEQHDMRIAAKRLRYILEVTEFCFGRAGPTARRGAKELQEILGELHDCDVALPRIERHLREVRAADAAAVRVRAGDDSDLDPALAARAPHRTTYRGLSVLAVQVEARRAVLYDRFSAFWAAQMEAGTWSKLERAAERALEEASRRREARERAAAELAAAEAARREAAERARRAAEELRAVQQTTAATRPAPQGPDGSRSRDRA